MNIGSILVRREHKYKSKTNAISMASSGEEITKKDFLVG